MSMGGTDRMNRNVYRNVSTSGKKWYWCIFTRLLDVAISNAWCLSKSGGGNYTQLEFLRNIANKYLKTYGTASQSPGRPCLSNNTTTSTRVPDFIRCDKVNHPGENTTE